MVSNNEHCKSVYSLSYLNSKKANLILNIEISNKPILVESQSKYIKSNTGTDS